MFHLFQTGRWRDGVLATFALTLLAFRALVPDGYMLAPAQDGVVTVQICTGKGVLDIQLDLATGEISPQTPDDRGNDSDRSQSHPPCPFAGGANIAVAAAPVAVQAPLPVVDDRVFLPAPERVHSSDPLRAPPARGPPAHV